MNWHPTPITVRAVPIRTVGAWVRDENGHGWGALTIWGGTRRCQWCHTEFSIGWASDISLGSIDVCRVHVVVDLSAPWIDEGGYMGVGDPIHRKPARTKRRAAKERAADREMAGVGR